MTASLQLDQEMVDRLARLAEARQTETDVILREAVEEYVVRSEERAKFQEAAIKAYEAYKTDGLHLTGQEVDEWLAKLENGKFVPAPECHK